MSEIKKAKRIQFDFSPEALDKLNRLVEITDAASKAEIIRISLRLLEYTIEKQADGYELKFEKGDEIITVAPWLSVNKNQAEGSSGNAQKKQNPK